MTPWITPYKVEEKPSGLLVATSEYAPDYGVSSMIGAFSAWKKMQDEMFAGMPKHLMCRCALVEQADVDLATDYPNLRDEFERNIAATPLGRWAAEVGEP